jgi:hypothetical protein
MNDQPGSLEQTAAQTAILLMAWREHCFGPAEGLGQAHFGRALMEAGAEALLAALPAELAEQTRKRIADLEGMPPSLGERLASTGLLEPRQLLAVIEPMITGLERLKADLLASAPEDALEAERWAELNLSRITQIGLRWGAPAASRDSFALADG